MSFPATSEYDEKCKMATLELKKDPARSDRTIATLVGLSKASMFRLRAQLEEAGEIPVIDQSKRIRVDGKNGVEINNNPQTAGPRIKVPHGMTLIDLVHAGLTAESAGCSPKEAAFAAGIGEASYRQARDIVRLSERTDLSAREAVSVVNAIGIMTREKRTREAFSLVKEIAERVWGGRHYHHTDKTVQKRVDEFMNAISVISVACDKGKSLTIPQINPKEVMEVILQLKDAVEALKELRSNLTRRMK